MKSMRDGRIMKQFVNEKGYLTISLTNGFFRKKYKSHRIVAIVFNQNPQNKPEVNHDDFDKTNNFYLNLIWATQKENTNHAQAGGRRPIAAPRPEKMGKIVYATKIVDTTTDIVYDSAYHLSRLIGVSEKEIRRQLCGERRNKTPYRYMQEKSKYIQEEYEMYEKKYLEIRQKIYGCAV